MRGCLLVLCAIWAVGCASESGGNEPFSVGAASTKKHDPSAPEASMTAEATPSDAVESASIPVAQEQPITSGPPRLIEHLVTPSDADFTVTTANEPSYAYVDTRVTTRAPLVVYLAGANVLPSKAAPMLQEIASYGFRVIGLRYMNDFVVQDICNANPKEVDCQGKLRQEVIQGLDVSAHVDVPPRDSVDTRLTKALEYLDAQGSGEGWASYLDNGQVTWANAIVAGHSSGSSSAARMSKLRELAGVMMLSGSNDNLNGVPSPWLSEPALTPANRIWAFSDTDDAQFPEHKRAWTALGLPGAVTSVDGKTTFGNSHRLTTSIAGGGHPTTQIPNPKFTPVWRTALGL